MLARWALLAWALSACRASDVGVVPEAHADEVARGGTGAPVAVVELFTSEGCSSCPRADAVLGELARESPSVVTLAFHVDYWDELGWPDRFSSADWTARQREYARSFGTSNLYTPQMVVGGGDAFVGSDKAHARESIGHALAHPANVPVSARAHMAGSEGVVVDVVAPGAPSDAVLGVALLEREATVDVRAGENAGRSLRHTSIVLAFSTAAPDHGSVTLPWPSGLSPKDAEVVVIVQRKPSGNGGMPILGAARASIAPSPGSEPWTRPAP
jgi:hypothetical protein